MAHETENAARPVPIAEAIKRIGKGRDIHTMFNPRMNVLIGADWSRQDVIAAMRKHGVEESGPDATDMGHPLVIRRYKLPTGQLVPLFIATKGA
jgi:hypothetical protein